MWLLVIDYRISVIDYTYMVIDYQQLLNVLIQILKLVIDYTHTVIDYQRRFSENILNSRIFSFGSWMAIKGLYICDLRHEFAKSFLNKKVLSS